MMRRKDDEPTAFGQDALDDYSGGANGAVAARRVERSRSKAS